MNKKNFTNKVKFLSFLFKNLIFNLTLLISILKKVYQEKYKSRIYRITIQLLPEVNQDRIIYKVHLRINEKKIIYIVPN